MIQINPPFRETANTRLNGWQAMPDALNEYTGKPCSRLERFRRTWWIRRGEKRIRIEVYGLQKGTRRLLFANTSVLSRITWRDQFLHVEVGGLALSIKSRDRR